MIILHRIDPLKCMHRWYSVHVQPTLFDHWSVVCAWGSLRCNFQQQRAIPCEGEEDADTLAAQIATRKEKRGYMRKENCNLINSYRRPVVN
jgi:predicted DNA-binding WGR domain protein